VRQTFDELINQKRTTGVTARTELAGTASSVGIDTQDLIEAKGVGLSLPVKVKLGVPLAAGHNRAILNVTLRDANASAVMAGE